MTRCFSIVRRLTLLVAGFGLLVVVLNMLLLPTVFGPVLEDNLLAQARQGALVQRLFQVTPAAQRPALLAELARLGYQVSSAPPPPLGEPRPTHPPQVLAQVRALLEPGKVLVHAAPPDHAAGLATSTQVWLPDGRSWWVTLSSAAPVVLPLAAAFAGLLVVGSVGAAAATFAVQLLTRPMAELARQLLDRRDALRPVQAPRRASVELQQVTDAFNQMVHALQAQEQRRKQTLAGLSHDLRTPLARLRLRAECTLPVDELRAMEADFEVLDRIIGQFVAFTHVGLSAQPAGRLLPLGVVLERLAARYVGRSGLSFLPLPAAPATWRYPDLSLVRLLANLIDNALEHGRLPVQVLAQDGDETGLWLWVRDAGPGLGPLARRLRGDALEDLGPGRAGGLGLKIADQIARHLGGSLQVLPHDGQWSAVGLYLPAPAAALSAVAVPAGAVA